MKKRDLIKRASQMSGIKQHELSTCLDAIVSAMFVCLQEGETIFLNKIGSLSIVQKRVKSSVIIAPGEVMTMKIRRVVKFRTCQHMKSFLNQGEPISKFE